MRLVQFVGKVGAGKTTLSKRLIEDLQTRGVDALTQPDAMQRCAPRTHLGSLAAWSGLDAARVVRVARVAALVGVAARHPRLIAQGLSSQHHLPISRGHRRVILGLFLRAAAVAHLLDRHLVGTEVAVLDEGLLHRAVNLFSWTTDRVDQGAVRRYVQTMPAVGAVVLVLSTDEAATQRLEARGHPKRLQQADADTVARFLAHSAEVVDIIGEELARRSDPVVTVVNDQTIDVAAKELLAGVEPLLVDVSELHPATSARLASRAAPSLPRLDRARRGRRQPGSPDSVIDDVLTRYPLTRCAPVRLLDQPGRSSTFVVPTDVGPVFLKRYKDSVDLAAVRNEHALLSHLQRRAHPAPRLIAASDGNTLIDTTAGHFALFEYLDGYFHYHDRVWTPSQTTAFIERAGTALASLHGAMASFPSTMHGDDGFAAADGGRVRGARWAADTISRCRAPGNHELEAQIGGLGGPLLDRMHLLEARLDRADPTRGEIHGDYGPYNLLFHWGRSPVVVDFELARFDWLITDVAKALGQFALMRRRIRPGRVQALLRGYRAGSGMASSEIALAPSVWEFLTLRRAVVCWQRVAETGEQQWLDTARRKVDRARSIETAEQFWAVPPSMDQEK